MSAVASVSSEVGRRYANALIELAEEASILPKIEQDVQDLSAMLASSEDLTSLIRSPLYDKKSLFDAVSALAEKAKLQALSMKFLGVLIGNGRLGALPEILDAFQGLMSEKRGEVVADVQIAQDLTAAQLRDLQKALSSALGSDVKVRAHVEPSILGGMIVTVGSKMIDDSVRRKLEKLGHSMGSGASDSALAANTNAKSSKLSEVI